MATVRNSAPITVSEQLIVSNVVATGQRTPARINLSAPPLQASSPYVFYGHRRKPVRGLISSERYYHFWVLPGTTVIEGYAHDVNGDIIDHPVVVTRYAAKDADDFASALRALPSDLVKYTDAQMFTLTQALGFLNAAGESLLILGPQHETVTTARSRQTTRVTKGMPRVAEEILLAQPERWYTYVCQRRRQLRNQQTMGEPILYYTLGAAAVSISVLNTPLITEDSEYTAQKLSSIGQLIGTLVHLNGERDPKQQEVWSRSVVMEAINARVVTKQQTVALFE